MQNTQAINVTAGNATATGSVTVSDNMPAIPCPGPAGYKYVGARYVPLFSDPLEWNSNTSYEPLTIVLYQGNSYTSRQYVPMGIQIDNTEFWALTGNYNAQIEQYRQEVAALRERLNLTSFTEAVSLELPVGSVFATRGYAEMNDGGGATYVISESSIPGLVGAPYGDATAYVVDEFINVKAIGCGSGSDDYSKLQAAIDASYDYVYFPEGTYSVSTTLQVTSNTTIIGQETRFVADNNVSSGPILKYIGEDSTYIAVMLVSEEGVYVKGTTPAQQVTIKNMGFDANNLCGHGLFVQMATRSRFDNVYGTQANISAIHIGQGWELTFGDLTASNSANGVVIGKNQALNSDMGNVNGLFIPNIISRHNNNNPKAGISGNGVVIDNFTGTIGNIISEANYKNGVQWMDNVCSVGSIWIEQNGQGSSSYGLLVNSKGLSIGTLTIGDGDDKISISVAKSVMIDTIYSPSDFNPFISTVANALTVNTLKGIELNTIKAYLVNRLTLLKTFSANTSINEVIYATKLFNNYLIILGGASGEVNASVSMGGSTGTITGTFNNSSLSTILAYKQGNKDLVLTGSAIPDCTAYVYGVDYLA